MLPPHPRALPRPSYCAFGRNGRPQLRFLSCGYQFFSTDEIAFIEAAIDHLIPEDELGPGAKGANVGIFIDRQLMGAFGSAGATAANHRATRRD